MLVILLITIQIDESLSNLYPNLIKKFNNFLKINLDFEMIYLTIHLTEYFDNSVNSIILKFQNINGFSSIREIGEAVGKTLFYSHGNRLKSFIIIKENTEIRPKDEEEKWSFIELTLLHEFGHLLNDIARS
ncbi:MAG: hypothetical protein HeimC3_16710 [Candidatus Heimdallarchaeota archaeon LC_3]|nr:MAG: hypothetical protein HeimC3_16710 [Candidatus Heimdallarchaeota archaeon LC_3]